MILTFVGLFGRIGPIPASQSPDCEFVIYFIRRIADSYSRLDSAATSWLVFDGLDTFATIELCGQPVGTANNQFRQWIYNVSNILKSCQGEPIISINFGSAPTIASDIANEPGQESELRVRYLLLRDRISDGLQRGLRSKATSSLIIITSFEKSNPILDGIGAQLSLPQDLGSQHM
jgi:hypothetical protein